MPASCFRKIFFMSRSLNFFNSIGLNDSGFRVDRPKLNLSERFKSTSTPARIAKPTMATMYGANRWPVIISTAVQNVLEIHASGGNLWEPSPTLNRWEENTSELEQH